VDVSKGGRLVQLTKVNGEWKTTVEGLFNLKAAFFGEYCSSLIKALEEATTELSQGEYSQRTL